jgi:hypothetical protein
MNLAEDVEDVLLPDALEYYLGLNDDLLEGFDDDGEDDDSEGGEGDGDSDNDNKKKGGKKKGGKGDKGGAGAQ